MIMHDKMPYDNSTLCHICSEELSENRVCDHCHLSGKFRGAAHEVFNLKYKVPTFLPVAFHNMSGYNSDLFINILGNSEDDISYIPNSEENYISFMRKVIVDKCFNTEGKKVNLKRELRFIDSFRYTDSRLDKLSGIQKICQFIKSKKCYRGNQLVFC